MARAGRVLNQQYIGPPEPSLLARGHLDLDFAVEHDDELALPRAMPVVVVARVVRAEDDARRRDRLGQPADLAVINEIDFELTELGPSGR